jgi:two-component system sensor histidine kinase CreC
VTIRTRIFLVFILVVGAGFYFLVQWIADDLRPRYLESLEEPVVDTAHILAEWFAGEFSGGEFNSRRLRELFQRAYQRRFKVQIYALEKQHVDMRVYVTDRQGIVVFDSIGRATGQDYSRWNDVYQTLRGRYGARASNEDTPDPVSAVLYIAAPIMRDGELLGVVSVGKPARNVDRFLAVAKYKLSVAGLIAALIVVLLGLGLYTWVSLPLEKLIRYAQAVKAGERVALPRLGRNEIGMMGTAMEEMRQELAGKEYAQRYVQTLTHELKSPLAAIRGAAELLDEEMPADQRRRFLSNIRTEAERLQDLVDRLLELAALEKRQSLENVETIPLALLLDDVITSLEPLTALQNVSISSHVADDIRVRGEKFLLRQAFANLLRNALEFSPEHGAIVITAEQRDHSVAVVIEDHGSGIPDYALDKIFERFYSLARPLPGAGNRNSRGTGLGLSFVTEVAQLHGGRVGLKNRPQGGAVATFELPLA